MGNKQVKSMPEMDAIDYENVPYSPLLLKAPVLTGTALRLLVLALESWLRLLLWPKLLRDNQFPQILDETIIPEQATYMPSFPNAAQKGEDEVTETDESDPTKRLAAALALLPLYVEKSEGFHRWTIRDYAAAYAKGSITPTKVAERFLEAVKQSEELVPPMRFFIAVDPADVRRQAAEATERYAEGKPLSVLDGVPIAIKDECDLLPYPTTAGSTFMAEKRPAKQDAIVCARLRVCGAMLVGKTNMHELGTGTTGLNEHFGTARNPYDVRHYTGGSSSGTAAVIAANLCPAAIGADAGGSIRVPSGLCGVVGLMPTFGRVPTTGFVPLMKTCGVAGPLTASVEDAILVYAAIAGAHPSYVVMSPAPIMKLPKMSDPAFELLREVKIGKYSEWFQDADGQVVAACTDALDRVTKTYGANVVEVKIPELKEMRTAHLAIVSCEVLNNLKQAYDYGDRSKFGWSTRGFLAMFKAMTASHYLSGQKIRTRAIKHLLKIFEKVDVIATPVCGMTAPLISESALKGGESNIPVTAELIKFVVCCNLTGMPAMSIPVGYDNAGLPIGLHLIAPPWHEAALLRLAAAVEATSAHLLKAPQVHYDLLTKT